jgi:hypothetical protein
MTWVLVSVGEDAPFCAELHAMLRDDDGLREESAAIHAALAAGCAYRGGGGAQPEFEIRASRFDPTDGSHALADRLGDWLVLQGLSDAGGDVADEARLGPEERAWLRDYRAAYRAARALEGTE